MLVGVSSNHFVAVRLLHLYLFILEDVCPLLHFSWVISVVSVLKCTKTEYTILSKGSGSGAGV